jgi:hypothetical protein
VFIPFFDNQPFVFLREFLSLGKLLDLESVGLAQLHTGGNIEDGFAATLAHMDVNRFMIVAVKKEAESIFLKNDWHSFCNTPERPGKPVFIDFTRPKPGGWASSATKTSSSASSARRGEAG